MRFLGPTRSTSPRRATLGGRVTGRTVSHLVAAGTALALLAASVAPASATEAARTDPAPAHADGDPAFDFQSHRGGRGEWTEESLHAFARSLELGVTTLELDTHLTEDGVVVVWHDDTIQPEKCRDTAPATPNDPDFPYVGDRVRELTWNQIQTLDCGYQQLPGYPQQEVVKGNRIAKLSDVFTLVREYGAEEIRWNIETKIEDPDNVAERNALVDAVVLEIYVNGWPNNTQLQSFDWAALDRAAPKAPELELVALAEAENPAGAGIDPQEVADRGYPVWSPQYTLLTEANIKKAHDLGLKVVPWTVNEPGDMRRLMDWGVDGIITDYPSTLRGIMAERGMELPTAYPKPDSEKHPRDKPGKDKPGKHHDKHPGKKKGHDKENKHPGRGEGHDRGNGPRR